MSADTHIAGDEKIGGFRYVRTVHPGATSVVLLQFLLRLDLSRSFLALLAVCAWVALCLFRLNAGRAVRLLLREFAAPHFVMVVGVGEPGQRLGRQLEEAAAYGVRLTGFLRLISEREP